jgi:hypothetical protein
MVEEGEIRNEVGYDTGHVKIIVVHGQPASDTRTQPLAAAVATEYIRPVARTFLHKAHEMWVWRSGPSPLLLKIDRYITRSRAIVLFDE